MWFRPISILFSGICMLFIIGLPPKFDKLSKISWKIWKFWKGISVDQTHSGGEGNSFLLGVLKLCYPQGCRLLRKLVLFNALSLWQRKLLFPLQFFFHQEYLDTWSKISVSDAPTNAAFLPLPIKILTMFNNNWLLHKYSTYSSNSVLPSIIWNAANVGWFDLEPSSSGPTMHYCFFLFVFILIDVSFITSWEII